VVGSVAILLAPVGFIPSETVEKPISAPATP
jgi:hypothetical protein